MTQIVEGLALARQASGKAGQPAAVLTTHPGGYSPSIGLVWAAAIHIRNRLTEPAARAALIAPAVTLGVAYEEKAARQIVVEAAGYPHFLR